MFVTQLARQHGRAFSSTLRSFTINGGGIQPLATKHQPSSSVCTPHPRNSLLTFSGEYHQSIFASMTAPAPECSSSSNASVSCPILPLRLSRRWYANHSFFSIPIIHDLKLRSPSHIPNCVHAFTNVSSRISFRADASLQRHHSHRSSLGKITL